MPTVRVRDAPSDGSVKDAEAAPSIRIHEDPDVTLTSTGDGLVLVTVYWMEPVKGPPSGPPVSRLASGVTEMLVRPTSTVWRIVRATPEATSVITTSST